MEKIDKIENSIALHQNTIINLEHIKEEVNASETEEIRFKIETKHWYGCYTPTLPDIPHLSKIKHKIDISKYSATVLLDTAIKLERERIDKLIDMEIEKRKENKDNE